MSYVRFVSARNLAGFVGRRHRGVRRFTDIPVSGWNERGRYTDPQRGRDQNGTGATHDPNPLEPDSALSTRFRLAVRTSAGGDSGTVGLPEAERNVVVSRRFSEQPTAG